MVSMADLDQRERVDHQALEFLVKTVTLDPQDLMVKLDYLAIQVGLGNLDYQVHQVTSQVQLGLQVLQA